MIKALKITIFSLSSLVVLALIAVFVCIWVIFTPAKLTPIVRKKAANYLTCQTEIGNVELTFFSTFPQFGLKINRLTLLNPEEGALSDTLLSFQTASATIDLKAWWKNNQLILNDIQFEDPILKAFVDKNGKANYDVYKSNSTDTTAFKNPFSLIDLQKLILHNAQLSYVNLSSDKKADLRNLNAQLNFVMKEKNLNVHLVVSSPEVSFRSGTTDYLNKAAVALTVPLRYDSKTNLLTLTDAKLNLNGLLMHLEGTLKTNPANGDVLTDMNFTTEQYQLKPLLKMIPTRYTSSLEGMEMDGIVKSKGTVTGVYNDKSMPLFNVNLEFEKGNYFYSSFPYKLHDIAGNVDVLVDMNNEKASRVMLNDVKAKTGQSELQAKGSVDYILADDMLFNLDMKMRWNLPELEPMMPDGMGIKLSGMAEGTAKARFMYSEMKKRNFEKMNISGKFDATNLVIVYDSLTMSADKARLDLLLPNKNTSAQFMKFGLWCDKMKVHKGNNTTATIFNVNLLTQTTDIRNTDKMNTINCNFDFDQLSASMDNMTTNLEKSKGNFTMKANFSDTISVPKISCDFDVQSLVASMDTMTVKVSYPKGKFTMQGDKHHPDEAVFDVSFISEATNATTGTKNFASKHMTVNTSIAHHFKETNKRTQWVPTGSIEMEQGEIGLKGLNAKIEIPSIQFDFTPDEFVIKNCNLLVDKSDFQLTGKLWNLSNYLNDKGLLNGDFNFTSNKTDVYKIMELTNGFNVPDSSTVNAKTTAREKSSGPYMVPKGMDLKLHAQVNEVHLGFDTARHVLGDLFLKDGLLVLRDMRFTTSAAKMQLTAMYKTPRRNHLFVGMDFHMTDMEISELLKMIPDVDTIMPMLRSFDGKGEFHIAVETYLDSTYHLKKSTLRGVSSVKGENLVLMDGQSFSEIAKKLLFSKHTVNKVDSLSAEFTIFKNEVDIYPFLIVMDKYKAVVAGRHKLDMTFDYHISLTDSPLPFRLGVNVTGKLGDMKVRLAKCKYANLYRPAQRREIDTKKLEIRQMIRDALTKEVIKQ